MGKKEQQREGLDIWERKSGREKGYICWGKREVKRSVRYIGML